VLIVGGMSSKLYLNYRNYHEKRIMIQELDEITDEVLLDIKIRTYIELSRNSQSSKAELLLASLYKIH